MAYRYQDPNDVDLDRGPAVRSTAPRRSSSRSIPAAASLHFSGAAVLPSVAPSSPAPPESLPLRVGGLGASPGLDSGFGNVSAKFDPSIYEEEEELRVPPEATINDGSSGVTLAPEGAGDDEEARVAVPAAEEPEAPKPPLRRPWFGYLILIACTAGLIVSLVLGGGFADVNVNPMIGPSSAALITCGAKVTSLIEGGQWWRLVSPMWLHAGIVHLAANMNMLWQMGFDLERGIGTTRFALLYITSGIFSMMYSAIFAPGSITVGASGALFGVLGALLGELCANCHLLTCRQRSRAFCQLGFTIAINLALGLLPFIDNFAHISGCISGFLTGHAFILHRDQYGLRFRQVCMAGVTLTLWAAFVVMGAFLLAANVNVAQACPWCEYMSCVPAPWWSCSTAAGSSP